MPNSCKKRIVSIVAVVAIILFSALFIYHFSIPPARIQYWIEYETTRYYPEESNTITINCKNHGGRDGNFRLALSLRNTSFSDQTEQPFDKLSSNLVNFPFNLHGGDSDSRLVFFSIQENVTYFSFYLSLESDFDLLNPVDIASAPISSLGYKWNETDKCYILSGGAGFS